MLLCTLAWFGLSPNLHVLGQNSAAVELTVSRTEMAVGQSVKVSLTFVNCKPTQLVPPEVDGLEFRMGPSTSTSTQWINGVTTSEQRFTYDYIARKEGEIKIP
ncbi:MAG: BatD like domain, partial [Bacteroidota bacterium]